MTGLNDREKEQELLAHGLAQLATFQWIVSSAIAEDSLDDSNENITETCFALSGEIFELAQELGWKSWKWNPEMDEKQVQKVAEEFADILAFLGRLMILICKRTGMNAQDMAAAYVGKSRKNVLRANGQSGEKGYGAKNRSY